MSANFPITLPTTASLRGNLVDNLATLLNGALTAGAVTITVDDTTGFPSAGLLVLQKADGSGNVEVCSYTGTTPTSFTGVTRNFNARYSAAWADNDVVNLFFAADHFNHLVEELIAVATLLGSNSSHIDLTGRAGKGIKFRSSAGVDVIVGAIDDGAGGANFGTIG